MFYSEIVECSKRQHYQLACIGMFALLDGVLSDLTDMVSTNYNKRINKIEETVRKNEELTVLDRKLLCVSFMGGKSSCGEEDIKEDDECCEINEKYIDSPYDIVFYFNQLLKNREQFIDFLEVFGELSYNAKQRTTQKKVLEMQLMVQQYREYIEKCPACYSGDDSEEIERERFRFSREALKLLDAAEADYADLKVE